MSNRRGLLHLLTSIFQELDIDIVDAKVETKGGVAHDVFVITDHRGGRIRCRSTLERLPALIAARVDHDDRENLHLATLTRTADILVVAVGYPELIRCAIHSQRCGIHAPAVPLQTVPLRTFHIILDW